VAHGALAGDAVAALFPPRVLRSVRLQRLRCGHRHYSQRASSDDDARKSRVRCDKSAESNARSRRRCACFISARICCYCCGRQQKRHAAAREARGETIRPSERAPVRPAAASVICERARRAPLSKHYTCINRRLYPPFKTKTSASRVYAALADIPAAYVTQPLQRCRLAQPASDVLATATTHALVQTSKYF
jgi:hypothetical protein